MALPPLQIPIQIHTQRVTGGPTHPRHLLLGKNRKKIVCRGCDRRARQTVLGILGHGPSITILRIVIHWLTKKAAHMLPSGLWFLGCMYIQPRPAGLVTDQFELGNLFNLNSGLYFSACWAISPNECRNGNKHIVQFESVIPIQVLGPITCCGLFSFA